LIALHRLDVPATLNVSLLSTNVIENALSQLPATNPTGEPMESKDRPGGALDGYGVALGGTGLSQDQRARAIAGLAQSLAATNRGRRARPPFPPGGRER